MNKKWANQIGKANTDFYREVGNMKRSYEAEKRVEKTIRYAHFFGACWLLIMSHIIF